MGYNSSMATSDDTPTPSVYELMRQVRDHPDFVFGTIFTIDDFDDDVPDDFNENRAQDALVEAGNDYIQNFASGEDY